MIFFEKTIFLGPLEKENMAFRAVYFELVDIMNYLTILNY